jgi:hypothetical protein
MTNRDVRDAIVRGFESVLAEDTPTPASRQRHVALKLAAVVEAHGVRLIRPAAIHDPAADWRNKPAAADPQLGANQVRAALYGTGQCPLCRTWPALNRDGTLAEHAAPDEDGVPVGCIGAGLEPAHPQPPAPRTHP